MRNDRHIIQIDNIRISEINQITQKLKHTKIEIYIYVYNNAAEYCWEWRFDSPKFLKLDDIFMTFFKLTFFILLFCFIIEHTSHIHRAFSKRCSMISDMKILF